MDNPSTLDSAQQWVKTALAYLGGYGGLAALLYFLLKKTLERTVDSRFEEHLETVRHKLQLEQQKMSVVYEQQKKSLRRVLVAMNAATEAIERNIEGEGDWFPISQNSVESFSRVAAQEALFLDGDTDHALRVFRDIMWSATQYEETRPMGGDVRRAYDQMKFISGCLAEHFRIKVGLESRIGDPVVDIDLLAACRLINRFSLNKFKLPTDSPFKFGDYSAPAELVAVSRKDPKLLKSELVRLREAITSDKKDSSFFYEALTEVNLYLGKLDAL